MILSPLCSHCPYPGKIIHCLLLGLFQRAPHLVSPVLASSFHPDILFLGCLAHFYKTTPHHHQKESMLVSVQSHLLPSALVTCLHTLLKHTVCLHLCCFFCIKCIPRLPHWTPMPSSMPISNITTLVRTTILLVSCPVELASLLYFFKCISTTAFIDNY